MLTERCNLPLSTYDWFYGTIQMAAAVLSIIAAYIAISMFKISKQKKMLRAWKYLLAALFVFAVEEVIGAIAVLGIYRIPYLTHLLPSVILALLIAALVVQIDINRGHYD